MKKPPRIVTKAACLVLATGLILTTVFTLAIGFAHTRQGRPLLALPVFSPVMKWMGMHLPGQACPMGFDHRQTFADRARIRTRLAAAHADRPLASSRQALDFVMGQTSRDDVIRWARLKGGDCKRLTSVYESECSGPFFHSVKSTLWLEFDASDRLVSERGIEEYSSPKEALSLFKKLRAVLKETGGGVIQTGDAEKRALAGGLLKQVSLMAEYRNYSVKARVTNMGNRFAVTHDFIGF